jgi:acyl-CoA thioester hydrolase
MSAFQFAHRVRYQETDAQSFAFNSRFLEWADVAMVEFFRDLGWSYRQMAATGFDPSVVTTTLTFARPVRFDDLITIEVRCTRVGNSSFDLEFIILRNAEKVADVATTYVNVDVASERSAPIPAPIAELLRREAAG